MGDVGHTVEYDVYAEWPTAHAQHTVQSWRRANQLAQTKTVSIDGNSLDIATVVALARLVNCL